MVKNRKISKKMGAALILIALVLTGLVVWLWPDKSNKSPASQGSSGSSPASPAEQKEAEQNKDAIQQRQALQEKHGETPSPSTQGSSNPVITYAGQPQTGGQVVVNAYMPNVYEDNGTCTLTLTKGSNKVVKSVTGFKNVRNTSCQPFNVERSELASSGEWTAVVAYSSPSANGSSQTKINVQ